MMRGGLAVDTNPKEVASLMFPCGIPNCAWLKALKNSLRNWRLNLSVKCVSFWMLISQLLIPGPWKKRRLAAPSCPLLAGTQNREGVKDGVPDRGLVNANDPPAKLGVSVGN